MKSLEKRWQRSCSNDKLRRRLVETLNVMDLLENVGRETILGLHNSPQDNLTDLAQEGLLQMTELITYCNEQFDKISKVTSSTTTNKSETLLYSYYE